MSIIDDTGIRRVAADGRLVFDGCDTVELARTYGTPLYVMSETAVRSRLRELKSCFMDRWPGSLAVYASKAFQTLELCRIVAEEGLGLDVVSGGELFAAKKAGFPLDRVFFHGNGKTEAELRMAVESGVGRVVVDNLDELEALDRIARTAGRRQPILFRITPGVDSHSHEYVSTGRVDSKFGIPLDPSVRDAYIGRALRLERVELLGFHFHVGSQLLENDSHLMAIRVLLDLMAEVSRDYGFTARELNLGGGFGVRYTTADRAQGLAYFTDAMMEALRSGCGERGLPLPRVILEPGRWVVGEAGITLYTVTSVKEIPGIKTWVAVDGGMPDNPRPALYGAKYEGVIADRVGAPADATVTVAGKCCETGDVLIRDAALQAPRRGDTLAVFTTGAYCHSMSSNYNRLPRPAVVMVANGEAHLSVRRETFEDLVARELP
jgi:diaminopimelate decarboxylase